MDGLTAITAQELAATFRLTEEQLSVGATHELFADIIKDMNKWSEIAPHLGLNSADRELIEEKSDLSQQRLYMLEKWKQKSGREATFFKLVEDFLRAERRDLAEKVCEFFIQNEVKSKIEEVFRRTIPLQGHNQQLPPGIAETRLGQESENTDQNETTPLISGTRERQTSSRHQHHTTEHKQYRYPYCRIFGGVLVFTIVSLSISLPMVVVADTIYNTPEVQRGAVHIVNDSAVLLGEYDPFYVGNVTCTSSAEFEAISYLYGIRCQNLTKYVYNETIEHSKNLNVTTNKTYSLLEQYLLEGSELDLNFEFVLNHSHLKQDCLGEVYVFDNFVYYDQFLQYGTGTEFAKEQYCLQNKTSSYSLKADETRYYLIGLDLQEPSTLEHIEFEVSGHKLYYDLSSYQPHCTIEPVKQPSCMFTFEKKHYRDSRNKICILGKTHEDSSQVAYEARKSDVITAGFASMFTIGAFVLGLSVIPMTTFLLMVPMLKYKPEWINGART